MHYKDNISTLTTRMTMTIASTDSLKRLFISEIKINIEKYRKEKNAE